MNGTACRASAPIIAFGLLALGCAGFSPGTLAAQDRIEERHQLRPDASVEIQVVDHNIRVERWDRNEIEVTGTYNREREELDIRAHPGAFRLQMRSVGRGNWSRRGSAELSIRVPEGVRIDLGSVSGSHEVSGLTGQVSVRSVSGSARVEGSPRSVTLETVSGSVTFRGASDAVRANTVSGSVEVDGSATSASAQSVSGRVRVTTSRPAERMDFNSVSGEVTFTGPLASNGRLRAESHSGSVNINLTGELDARFDLSTFSGRLSHDLDGVRNEERYSPRWGPGEELSFEMGAGRGRVEVKSFSGSVRIGRGSR